MITNRRHEPIRFDSFDRYVLSLLDGSRDLAQQLSSSELCDSSRPIAERQLRRRWNQPDVEPQSPPANRFKTCHRSRVAEHASLGLAAEPTRSRLACDRPDRIDVAAASPSASRAPGPAASRPTACGTAPALSRRSARGAVRGKPERLGPDRQRALRARSSARARA